MHFLRHSHLGNCDFLSWNPVGCAVRGPDSLIRNVEHRQRRVAVTGDRTTFDSASDTDGTQRLSLAKAAKCFVRITYVEFATLDVGSVKNASLIAPLVRSL